MGSFELRPVRRDDLAEIGAVIRRTEAYDGLPHALSLEEVEQDLDHPHIDLDLDTRVAVAGGAIVGWSWLWNAPSEARLERAYCFGEVDPAHRGQGIGRELLGWCRDRAIERLRSRDHDLPLFVRVSAYDWLEENLRLYRRLGFEPVRWDEELLRPLGEPAVAPVPAGIEILPWPGPERDEELRAVRNDAFGDHWGSSPLDTPTWTQQVRGYGARVDLSAIAVVAGTGEIAGLCLNHAYPEDETVAGRRDAWIHNLATARPWRGRGVASALVAAALSAFAADGTFTHAAISVDADNLSGAARLYRNLGFELLVRSVTYQIEVARR